MQTPLLHPSHWADLKLIAFDVDGTLYNQRSLRIRLARDILFRVLLARDLRFLSVIKAYRSIRERLGDQEIGDFEGALVAETAVAAGCSTETVQAIVAEWMEMRPLPYLAGCRYPGLQRLFAGLRRNGKVIGIFSDYPARAKLTALGLAADLVVSAADEGVGFLKPHPRGLEFLIAAANVRADETVLIGDRKDRDGLAARRVGAWSLIRSSRPIEGWQTFTRYDDPLFAPVLADGQAR